MPRIRGSPISLFHCASTDGDDEAFLAMPLFSNDDAVPAAVLSDVLVAVEFATDGAGVGTVGLDSGMKN